MKTPLKMPGAKTRVMPQILPHLPRPSEVHGKTLVPFFGTGASALALDAAGYDLGRLSEGSPWIHRVHEGIRRFPCFEQRADRTARDYEKEGPRGQRYAYNLDRSFLNNHGPKEVWPSRVFIVWRMAFNGLMRVNRKGLLNAPPGVSKEGPAKRAVYDRELLREFVTWWRARPEGLYLEDFAETCRAAVPGDFVYLDPPYEGTFKGYLAGGFSTRRLVAELLALCARGVSWAMSNSTALDWAGMFPGAKVFPIPRAGTVSSDGANRGKVGEVLVVFRA